MSIDLKIALECDHRIVWEIGAFDVSDMRSVLVARPIQSSRVVVRASGNVLDPNTYSLVADKPTYAPKKIFFKEERKSYDDVYEITYYTDYLNCSKCSTLKNLDDIQYDNSGRLIQLKDEYLLLQNVEKFVITELGSNPFHSWVGTGLVKLSGTKILDSAFIQTKISSEISDTLKKFKSMQNQQLGTTRPMTSGEILESVDSIKVVQDAVDPTIFRVGITITANSGKSVTYQQYLKFIGPSTRQRA